MRRVIIIIVSGILLIPSCSKDFLEKDPISSQSTSAFYKTESDFEQAVNAIYDGLSKVYTPLQSHAVILGSRCDEFTNGGDISLEINNFTDDATFVDYWVMWQKLFQGVYRCNVLLSESQGINKEDIPKIERFRAEARFLRGIFYFDLVRTFGGMPLYERNVSIDEYYTIPRSSAEETYNFIIDDFRAAAAVLPAEYKGNDIGRATSWAAKGFLAKVLLYMEKYEECLSLCNEIINSGKFQFLPVWVDIFNEDNDNGPQALFQIQYISGGDGEGNEMPGLYMNPNAKTFAGRTFSTRGATGYPKVTGQFYNSFDTSDVRRDFSIIRNFLDLNGNPQTGSFVGKFTVGAYDAFDFLNWGINHTLLRFTEILLMKAECINELSGPTAEAVEIVDQIRDRAGLPALTDLEKANKQSFFDALVRERAHELAFEDNRWFDLVRWGIAEKVINDYLGEQYPDFNYKMESYHVLFPIPHQEIENIGDEYVLWQNPGYN
jgi:starch-binding outer membrane protein, SusD/RagB family